MLIFFGFQADEIRRKEQQTNSAVVTLATSSLQLLDVIATFGRSSGYSLQPSPTMNTLLFNDNPVRGARASLALSLDQLIEQV